MNSKVYERLVPAPFRTVSTVSNPIKENKSLHAAAKKQQESQSVQKRMLADTQQVSYRYIVLIVPPNLVIGKRFPA